MLRDLLAITLVYTIGFAVFVNLMIFVKIGFFKLRSYVLEKYKVQKAPV
jgi:hypothetical protein